MELNSPRNQAPENLLFIKRPPQIERFDRRVQNLEKALKRTVELILKEHSPIPEIDSYKGKWLEYKIKFSVNRLVHHAESLGWLDPPFKGVKLGVKLYYGEKFSSCRPRVVAVRLK